MFDDCLRPRLARVGERMAFPGSLAAFPCPPMLAPDRGEQCEAIGSEGGIGVGFGASSPEFAAPAVGSEAGIRVSDIDAAGLPGSESGGSGSR